MTRAKKKSAKKKPKKSAKALVRLPIGKGFFAVFERDGTPRGIEMRDIPGLRKIVGDDLLVPFVQAFNAAERLDTFVSLMTLNREHVKKPSLGHNRNYRILMFLIFGTLYEAMSTLARLRSAGIERAVNNSNAWMRLNAMRLRWAKDPLLKTLKAVRHSLAHHLGDDLEIRAGLAAFSHGEKVMLFETDGGGTRKDTVIPLALDTLLKGLAFDQDAFLTFMDAATTDSISFGHDIQALITEVLIPHGVKFANDI